MNARPASDVRLKLAAALLAFAAGVGAVVTAVLLAHSTLSTAGSSSTGSQAAASPSSSTPAAAQPSFPVPPAGALVLAREDRDLAVGLAASRYGGRLALQASVIGQDQPAQGLSVSFRLAGRGKPVAARPCGAGCYRALVDPASAPQTVEVAIGGPNRPDSTVSFPLPASLPGPSAATLVSRAGTAWRALETLVDHDRLSSGPGSTIHTLWRFVAPYRLTYRITNGPEAVVIGGRRWDKLPGHAWQGSQQDPIRQPIPLWEAVSNAHLLGSARLRGRPVLELSFFDPQIQAWFTIWVDRATMRTLELRMIAQAHFMHEVYGPFNRPLRIVPPTKAKA